jgi:hypothetical protein
MGFFLDFYFLFAFVVAILGRNRLLGFWGNLALSLIISPVLVAIMIAVGSPRRERTIATG